MFDGATRIATLRVRGAERDSPALRLALGRSLGGADLRPAGAPPSSILILRRFTDPLPGRHVVGDREWEQAVRRSIDDRLRRAARPRNGRLPPGCEAVFFRDEAELLAFLALALARRERPAWWWPLVMGRWNAAPSFALTPLLLAAARVLPPALRSLWDWGRARHVATALSDGQAMAVLGRMIAVHELRGLELGPSPAAPRPAAKKDPATPWSGRLRPDPATLPLTKAQAALLGVALTLTVHPAAVKAREFVAAWSAWWPAVSPSADSEKAGVAESHSPRSPSESPQPPPAPVHFPRSNPNAARGRKARPKPRRAGPRSPVPPVAPAAGPAASKPRPTEPGKLITAKLKAPGPFPAIVAGVSMQAMERGVSPIAARANLSYPPPERPPAVKRRRARSEAPKAPVPVACPDEGLPTRLAGALYLVNLMEALELPECFEEDWELASRVGRWGLLEALARAFLEGHSEQAEDDPLWRVLAELDGRAPGRPPGAGLQGNDSFQLPVFWLRPPASRQGGRWLWAADRQTVRVWSSLGFVLAETPRRESAPSRLARECIEATEDSRPPLRRRPMRQAPLRPLQLLRRRGWNPHLLRWLGLAVPFLEWRLEEASRGSGDGPLDFLFTPGRLHLTSTHMDLVMSLEDASLAARLAGLDRNPGWLPAWGRVVLFHFE